MSTSTKEGNLMYKRFEILFSLFQKGIVLADNMFVLEEGQMEYFYYVIEPYLVLDDNETPFLTLQQFLLENRNSLGGFEKRRELFSKCKNLLDHLSMYDQAYCGLNSRKIVVDDEENVFLLPFSLKASLVNKPYERSYYPVEVLRLLQNSEKKEQVKSL